MGELENLLVSLLSGEFVIVAKQGTKIIVWMVRHMLLFSIAKGFPIVIFLNLSSRLFFKFLLLLQFSFTYFRVTGSTF